MGIDYNDGIIVSFLRDIRPDFIYETYLLKIIHHFI